MTDSASPFFPLGRTLAAPGALDALARPGNHPGTGFGTYLTRHVTGDWGELDSEAHAANDWAVVFGDERVLSHYRLPDQTSIWVILVTATYSGVPYGDIRRLPLSAGDGVE